MLHCRPLELSLHHLPQRATMRNQMLQESAALTKYNKCYTCADGCFPCVSIFNLVLCSMVLEDTEELLSWYSRCHTKAIASMEKNRTLDTSKFYLDSETTER